MRASWYNLSTLTKDERKIIYGKLGYAEWVVARVTHNLPVDINAKFANECAEKGHLDLLERFNPPIDGIFWVKCMENKNYRILHWAGDRARPNDDTFRYLIEKKNRILVDYCIYRGMRPTDGELYLEAIMMVTLPHIKKLF
jgi:hypothetical protein